MEAKAKFHEARGVLCSLAVAESNFATTAVQPSGASTHLTHLSPAAGSGATGGQVDALHSIVAGHDGTPPQQAAPQEGTPAEQPTDSTVQEEQHSEHPVLDEFELELKKAQDNPSDFNQWVAVEKLVDKLVGLQATLTNVQSVTFWSIYAQACSHLHRLVGHTQADQTGICSGINRGVCVFQSLSFSHAKLAM